MGRRGSFHDLKVMPGLGKRRPAIDGEIWGAGENQPDLRKQIGFLRQIGVWKSPKHKSRSLGPEIPSSENCQENSSRVEDGKYKKIA